MNLNAYLIYPMAFYAIYMSLLGLLLFIVRYRAVKSGQVSYKYFKTLQALQGQATPEWVITVGRHYDNQFQLPILFFVTAMMCLVVGPNDQASLILAWAFVASRLVHSFIHLGSNNIITRAATFGFGWLVISLMWWRILFFALG